MALETGTLAGKVTDVDGKPVEGSVISVYFDDNSRRKPDYMSLGTDKEGFYSVVLPPGKYWAVARFNSDKRIGPLTPGGKYSGEPVEIEISATSESREDFIVADIKDVARMGTDTAQDMVKLEGRIIDQEGKPVSMAYVFANKKKSKVEFPDYLSAWSDEKGRFFLYLPRGEYYVGASATFPLAHDDLNIKTMILDADQSNMEVVMHPPSKGD